MEDIMESELHIVVMSPSAYVNKRRGKMGVFDNDDVMKIISSETAEVYSYYVENLLNSNIYSVVMICGDPEFFILN